VSESRIEARIEAKKKKNEPTRHDGSMLGSLKQRLSFGRTPTSRVYISEILIRLGAFDRSHQPGVVLKMSQNCIGVSLFHLAEELFLRKIKWSHGIRQIQRLILGP